MKYLGIDYGEKRIGLAISDESLTLARELAILSPTDFWKQILPIIETNQITKIILGWPLNMSGRLTEKTKEVENFRQKLLKKLSARGGSLPRRQAGASGGKVESKTGLPIEIIDERLSTSMTKNLPGGHTDKDSLAAQIILQNYLNRESISESAGGLA